ncbi:MAG: VOC family protein [Gammaproteobacteria bacterium]|mgnify:CR=1 FL=1|nr:glyoxalase [Gammaproteobacteria bacterium]
MELLVNVDVGDLAAGERFYRDALGLAVGRRFGSWGVELRGASSPIYLLHKEEGSPVSPATDVVRAYERHWTPVHLDFVVDDIEKAVERAVAAGATLEEPVAVRRWGKLALLADPFGNGFCFVELVGRGYDEIVD